MEMRGEHDSMGQMQVPATALYGAQTRRAQLNFPVSGWPLPPRFIRALAKIKLAAAQVNLDLGRLDARRAELIVAAAGEIVAGQHAEHFVVDVFQTGSGTSTNMNLNEVIANRAIQLAGGVVGSRDPVHPNDHVNLGQSSNDAIPSALHLALAEALTADLLPALDLLEASLERKTAAFARIIKIGRTHLQDATPLTLGQVFSGYAASVNQAHTRLSDRLPGLLELPLGGTAVGTGINTHPEFAARVAGKLTEDTGLAFREAANHFAAQGARDDAVALGGELKCAAVALAKIANDIRFLGSGPRGGLGELKLPAVQPGSSIMPGKVNPVICESLIQAAAYAVGADASVTWAASLLGNFELNVSLPILAHQLLETIRILANAVRCFASSCVDDLEADEAGCAARIEQSLAMCTRLAPLLGYDAAAAIAKEAYATGRTVREVAVARQVLPAGQLDEALDPWAMIRPE